VLEEGCWKKDARRSAGGISKSKLIREKVWWKATKSKREMREGEAVVMYVLSSGTKKRVVLMEWLRAKGERVGIVTLKYI